MNYVVRRGDTLSAIAARTHLRTSVIGYINRVSNLNRLRVGQVLLLPTGAHHVEPLANPHGASPAISGHHAPVDIAPLRALSPPHPAPDGDRPTKLGDLSMLYETRHRPGQEVAAAATVSSGVNDPDGGVSYGAYQFSSKQGVVGEFLRSDGARWARQFGTEDPTVRDGAFGKTWKSIASSDGQTFFKAQHDYIKRTHYDKAIRRIYEATGINLDTAGIAIRNVVWSMAVQHGRAVQVIEEAMRNVHGVEQVADASLSPYQAARASFGNEISYQRQLLLAMYEARIAYVRRIGKPDLVRRYDSEEIDALAEFTKYGTESDPQ